MSFDSLASVAQPPRFLDIINHDLSLAVTYPASGDVPRPDRDPARKPVWMGPERRWTRILARDIRPKMALGRHRSQTLRFPSASVGFTHGLSPQFSNCGSVEARRARRSAAGRTALRSSTSVETTRGWLAATVMKA